MLRSVCGLDKCEEQWEGLASGGGINAHFIKLDNSIPKIAALTGPKGILPRSAAELE